MEQNICCPEFNPAPWDNKEFEWQNKKFVKGKVFTLWYMPVNFGGVISCLFKKMEKVGATNQDYIGLSDHTSKWNMDLYVATDKDVPGVENVTLSGKFISKVYEGKFSETKKWCDDFEKFVKEKGLSLKKQYMWYTTCPKCAKKYRKNYVVIVGQIS